MAQKLNSQYNFSYSNLKVLLGGWRTWKERNAQDAGAYPIEATTGASPATPGSDNLQAQPGVVQVTATVVNPAPAATMPARPTQAP